MYRLRLRKLPSYLYPFLVAGVSVPFASLESEKTGKRFQNNSSYSQFGSSDRKVVFNSSEVLANQSNPNSQKKHTDSWSSYLSSFIWRPFDSISTSNGDRYTGEYKSVNDVKIPHGKGVMVFDNGNSTYQGDWLDGEMTGYGVMTNKRDGSSYLGHFLDGQYHGMGVLTTGDGDVYKGEFQHGKPHGSITVTYRKSKAVYKGNMSHGLREGFGELSYEDGEIYRGIFANDVKHGHGVWKLSSGVEYEGDFLHDLREGQGTCSYPDGTVYIGHYAQDKQNGFGVLRYKDGSCYEGEFLNDVKHGFGFYTLPIPTHIYNGNQDVSTNNSDTITVANDSIDSKATSVVRKFHGKWEYGVVVEIEEVLEGSE